MYHRSNIFGASNEGSILILCTTSPALGLIKPHDRSDHLPPEGNVVSSSAELKDESQLKVPMLVRKPKLKSSKEKLLFCVQFKNNLLQLVQTKNNFMIDLFTKHSEKKQDKNC